MKRFVITISCLLCAALLVLGLYYAGGVYLHLGAKKEPSIFVRTQDKTIELAARDGWEAFEIRGVDLGSGLPGAWSTDYAIDRETYLRWFSQMQQMGANTVRVYAVQVPEFYRALDDYNKAAESPLYLLQGIWLSDYVQNSHKDAFDRDFQQKLIESCREAVDALHGKRFILSNDADAGAGLFLRDVSRWTIGYVIGGEWTDVTVAYTDEKYHELSNYEGSYLSSALDASAFETMLAEVGDHLVAYETDRYHEQRLLCVANTKTTDPFTYPQEITEFFQKCACIDAEHIRAEDGFEAGLFAGYSAYRYDLDYLSVMEPAQWQSLTEKEVDFSSCDGTQGSFNTYLAYWKLLNAHHTMPVVALEFGAASGRTLAQENSVTGAQEGAVSEAEQAELIVSSWEDLTRADCAGGCVFSWQDEWHKRTWNDLFAVDFSRSPYWSDAQSSNQHFGLLAFDPGKEACCVVDGKADEWEDEDVVIQYEDGSSVSLQYDERYLYLLIRKPGFVFGEDTLYLPIDTTQKTGSRKVSALGLEFERAADFLLKIHTKEDSEIMAQDRYHAIHANFEAEITGNDAYLNPPAKDSETFETEQIAVKDAASQFQNQPASLGAYETGKLRFGNADPQAEDYDSLTDFAAEGDSVEVRLAWGLLNFADPSRMQIHDDYYDGNYGVEFLTLKKLFIGLGNGEDVIAMGALPLKGWGNSVRFHERLKPSYHALKACWMGGDGA